MYETCMKIFLNLQFSNKIKKYDICDGIVFDIYYKKYEGNQIVRTSNTMRYIRTKNKISKK